MGVNQSNKQNVVKQHLKNPTKMCQFQCRFHVSSQYHCAPTSFHHIEL